MKYMIPRLIKNIILMGIFIFFGVLFICEFQTFWTLFATLVIWGMVASHCYHDYVNTLLVQNYLSDFKYIPETNSFYESRPKLPNITNKPFKKSVLFLHGWSGSPAQLDAIIPYLEKEGIAFFAPQLTGFGLGDTHLLNNIRATDWIRDAINAYDLLSHVSKEVDIIGHSNGACLALIVSQYRRTDNIILTSPNFVTHKRYQTIRGFLLFPITGQLLRWCRPIFKKGHSNNYAADGSKIFHYPALPISSLVALWEVQGLINLAKAKFKHLTVLAGKNDIDVDINKSLKFLDKNKIFYKKVIYENSEHNLMHGIEKDKIAQDIIHFLRKDDDNYKAGSKGASE